MTQQQNRIAVVSMVRDEADVIESFVRHNLTVADALYIIDHASNDGTSDILAALVDEGLPLAVTRYDGVAQIQAELLTALMAQAFADGADLVLPLDADEFIWPEAGGTLATARATLQALPTQAVYAWLGQWDCTLVMPETGADRLLFARPARRVAHPASIGKVFVGRAAYEVTRAQHGRLLQGNHQFVIDGTDGPSRIVPKEVSNLFLAHFPWRSAEQAAAKEAIGWIANVAKYSRQTTRAFHWREGFERVLAGEAPRDPLTGVETIPLPPPGKAAGDAPVSAPGRMQRYHAFAERNVLRSALLAAEQLAEAYRESEILRLGRVVSVIVPYLGDAAPFEQSLASVFAEGYPHAELVVLPLVRDAFAAELPQYLAAQETALRLVLLEGADHDALFADLAASAQGNYVQWLLPGQQLRPGKLIRMVAALACNDALTFVMSCEKEAGALPIGMEDPFQEAEGDLVATAMRAERKTPAGGIAAPLFRRATMEQHAWLAPFFTGEELDIMGCWLALLPGAVVGMMRDAQLL